MITDADDLVAVYRAGGHEREDRQVLVAARDDLRRYGSLRGREWASNVVSSPNDAVDRLDGWPGLHGAAGRRTRPG